MKDVSTGDHHEPSLYEIRLKGYLDARWAGLFEDLSLAYESDGTTILSGPMIDQPALHGLLRKVRDLGLTLVSVAQVARKQSNEADVQANSERNHSKKESNR